MGLHVSAQGVTNAAAAVRPRELGCAFAQGPYFAALRPAEMIPPLLAPGGLAERIASHEDHAREPIDAPTRTTQ
jgi:EAL domain-containing protein (putative c-di-GMP-specific phosphodiesterase class I)